MLFLCIISNLFWYTPRSLHGHSSVREELSRLGGKVAFIKKPTNTDGVVGLHISQIEVC